MFHLILILVAATSTLACDPVQNLAITSVRSSEIQISWSVPSANNVQCIQSYKICSTPESCTTVQNSSITKYSITGLNSCRQYSVSVVTLDKNNGTSTPSVVVASTAPGPLPHVGFSREDKDRIAVLWSYALTAGRTCATQFQLSLCDDSGANCSNTNIAVDTVHTHYTQYLQKKRSCNAYSIILVAMDSSQQMSDSIRYNGEPDLTDAPENLTAANFTSSSFDLGWAIPNTRVDCDFYVTVSMQSMVHGVGNGYTILYNGDVTRHSQKNVTSCTMFNVSVHFRVVEDSDGATILAYTLPVGDKIFDGAEVQGQTSSSLLVAWNSSLPIDQCVANYSVCWTKLNATAVDCQNATKDKNNLNIQGLAADTKYNVSVTALLHTGIRYDVVTLEASTKSGAAGIIRSSLVGTSTLGLTLCLLMVFI